MNRPKFNPQHPCQAVTTACTSNFSEPEASGLCGQLHSRAHTHVRFHVYAFFFLIFRKQSGHLSYDIQGCLGPLQACPHTCCISCFLAAVSDLQKVCTLEWGRRGKDSILVGKHGSKQACWLRLTFSTTSPEETQQSGSGARPELLNPAPVTCFPLGCAS